MERLLVETCEKTHFVDITTSVAEAVRRSGAQEGACLVFSPHTTAGITLNEHADPAVAEDVAEALESLAPPSRSWRHTEGNSPAHAKVSMVGSSVLIGISGGRLALGTWQGIFLCEFDGPRTREVWIQLLS